MKKVLLAAATAFLLTTASQAQIVTPQASPLAKVEQRIGVADVTLTYSRPSAKGRKVFGDVRPWGEIWRFGANQPTKIKFSDSVMVGKTWLAPGEYAIYATPMQNGEWPVFFGKDTKVQADDFKTSEAAASLMVKTESLPMSIETMTLDFMDITSTSSNLTMMWEKTSIKIPLTFDVDRKVTSSIQKTMNDVNNYWSAANYYFETNKDMKQALVWVDKVVEKNPAFWVLNLKAKIQHKLGDNKGAIASAEMSIVKAKEAKNNDYVKMNEKLIAEIKAGK
jgi:hypothetical protein